MRTDQIALMYFIIWLTIFGSSREDGFNFYKALNRTPMNRVERFYRDGISSRYKVPLSKRLFYGGYNEQKSINGRQNQNFVAILFKWTPDVKFNFPSDNERNGGECADTQNFIPDIVFV